MHRVLHLKMGNFISISIVLLLLSLHGDDHTLHLILKRRNPGIHPDSPPHPHLTNHHILSTAPAQSVHFRLFLQPQTSLNTVTSAPWRCCRSWWWWWQGKSRTYVARTCQVLSTYKLVQSSQWLGWVGV